MRRPEIQPKANNTAWTEIPNLWGLVADPGQLKSPTIAAGYGSSSMYSCLHRRPQMGPSVGKRTFFCIIYLLMMSFPASFFFILSPERWAALIASLSAPPRSVPRVCPGVLFMFGGVDGSFLVFAFLFISRTFAIVFTSTKRDGGLIGRGCTLKSEIPAERALFELPAGTCRAKLLTSNEC